jgi:hypothetical protein
MEIIYGVTHPYEVQSKCIHCDWRECYYDEIKTAALVMVQEWNKTNTGEHALTDNDWDVFIDEAIEVVSQYHYVDTSCDSCL